MLKKYSFWLALVALVAGLVAIGQGCGSSNSTTHTIYGATS